MLLASKGQPTHHQCSGHHQQEQAPNHASRYSNVWRVSSDSNLGQSPLCVFSRSGGHSRLQPHPRPQSQFRHGSRNAKRSMRATKQIVPRQQTRNCSICPGCFQEASNPFQCALRAAIGSRKALATSGFWNCDQAPTRVGGHPPKGMSMPGARFSGMGRGLPLKWPRDGTCASSRVPR